MSFKKKIVFFEMDEWEKAHITKNLIGFDIEFFKGTLNPKNVDKIKNFDILAVFIYSKVTKEILNKLPKLRLIVTLSTGYDHIDLEECNNKNITVCNVPTYGENTVAEHTFALILALSRKVFQSIERTKKRNFNYDGLRGFDLKGKTLGLIGTGHISAHAARIAHGFDMKLVGYDVIQNQALIKDYGLKYVDLDTLMKESDIVSLHLPLNDKTKYIINERNISLMKPSALIINTSRGGLIETQALVKVLQTNKIAGAGLDVLEEEHFVREEKQLSHEECNKDCNQKTLRANHTLLQLDNAVVTPHNAFNSTEAMQRILDTSIENIKCFESGSPKNIVVSKHI